MAWERQSPGIYKNTETGEIRRSATKPTDGGSSSSASTASTATPATVPPNPALVAARANLNQQVATGGITQAQADAEYNRLVSIGYNGTSSTPLAGSLQTLLANDPAIAAAIDPALGIAGLGSGGMTAAQGFFGDGSLGRVTETIAPEMQYVLDQAKAAQQASTVQDPYATQGLQGLATTAANSANISPDVQLALDTRRAGLEGYTPAEMQAFREQNLPGLDNQLNAALRVARLGGIDRNITGGMAAAELPGIVRANQDATRGLERDIFLANIAERMNRLAGFESLARGVDTDIFNRQLQSYGALTAGGQNQQNINTAVRSQGLQDLGSITSGIQNDILNRRIFNLNQLGREKSGQLGLLFGTLGLASENEGARNALDLAKEQLSIARIQAEKSGGSGGGGSTSFNFNSFQPETYQSPSGGYAGAA